MHHIYSIIPTLFIKYLHIFIRKTPFYCSIKNIIDYIADFLKITLREKDVMTYMKKIIINKLENR